MARILIVDADTRTAELVAEVLRVQGHQCRAERFAERAIDIIERKTPDLVILDIMLPGTGGFEVCRRIRRHPALYTTPILVLSSMSDRQEIEHALAQGGDEFMAKPFDAEELAHRVAALLDENAGCYVPDPVTGLPNAKRIRRELQRKICERVRFCVAYVEVLNLRPFGREHGTKNRDKAVSWTAEALNDWLTQLDGEKWILGHMGGGHFVCLVTPGKADFCNDELREHCRKRFHKLYQSLTVIRNIQPLPGTPATPELDMLACMTVRRNNEQITPQRVFETLTQVRHKALMEHPEGGVYIDSRRA